MDADTTFLILGDKTVDVHGYGDNIELALNAVVPAESKKCTLYIAEREAAHSQQAPKRLVDRVRRWMGLPPRNGYIPVGTLTFEGHTQITLHSDVS